MANITSPIGWMGNGLTSGLTSGMNYLGGAALDRLGGIPGLDPMTGLMPGAGMPMGSADPMLQMLMQMLMGLMSNSGGSLMDAATGQGAMGDMVSQLGGGGGGGGSFGGGGGGGGSVGGGGGGGGYSGGGGGGGSVSSSGGGGSSYSGPVPDSGPVAPGTAALLKDAGKMVGLQENSDTAEIQKITGKSGINPSTTPWCAAFAINMMKDHGVLDTEGLSNPNYCPTVKSWAQGKEIWGEAGKYKPKPGDAILFDWEQDGTSDHIGIVESVKNGKVYTIEGNSSDSVKRNTYDLGDSNIDGYVVSKDTTPKADKKESPKKTEPAAKTPAPTTKSSEPAPKTKAPEPKAKPAPTTTTPKPQPTAV